MVNEMTEIERYQRRSLPTPRDLAALLFRQRWTALIASACVIAALLVSGLWKTKYEAHMKILVLRQRTDAVVSAQPDAPAQLSPGITEEELNSEVELIRSNDLLQSVVLAAVLQTKGGAHSVRDERRIALAVAQLDRDLDVEAIRKANVIAIRYRAANPEIAVRVLNAVAAAYMEKHRQVRHPSDEVRFFDQQTERYRRGLQESEEQLAEFTRTNGVASALVERDLTLQRVAEFDASANDAHTSATEAEQRIRSLQAQLQARVPRLTTEIKTAENPELMQQLKSTLLNLELKKTGLLTKFDPAYRLVREVDHQIAETRAAIAAAESRPSREETTNADPTYLLLQGELAKTHAELSGFRARAAATRSVADTYRDTARRLELESLKQEDLQRTHKLDEDNYFLYLRKREEARISDALDRHGILNVAVAEQPIAPAFPMQSPIKKAAVALLLCFFASCVSAVIVDGCDPCFRTPDEVTALLGIPVLTSLPKEGVKAARRHQTAISI